MIRKVIYKAVASALMLFVLFSFVVPWLASAKDTPSVVAGIFLALLGVGVVIECCVSVITLLMENYDND